MQDRLKSRIWMFDIHVCYKVAQLENDRVILYGDGHCADDDREEDEDNVHKSRKQRISPSNCERDNRFLNE